MSDIDAAEEIDQPIEVEEAVTDLNSAIRRVLKNAIAVDGLVRGLHETAKALEAGRANVCFLASSCNEDNYKKLIQALCLEQNVPLIEVPDNKQLGEWAGLCKIDKDGNPRKVVGASVVAVTNYERASSMSTLYTTLLLAIIGLVLGFDINSALSLDETTLDKVISNAKNKLLIRFDKTSTRGENEVLFGNVAKTARDIDDILVAFMSIEGFDKEPEKAEAMKKYGVEELPTFIMFVDGKEVSRYNDGEEVTHKTKFNKWLIKQGVEILMEGTAISSFDKLLIKFISTTEGRDELLETVKEMASSDKYKDNRMAQIYPKIMDKISSKGVEYCDKEFNRLKALLASSGDSINSSKRREMKDKIVILEICKDSVTASSSTGGEL
ncbi:40S ribosomal protein S12 [Perkinsus chesapeaki]|uniref:40S ribosomal protein S12 n=1 Tax=Perkinsus chesapeaki TaxID=330153 RepID=A0A7J6LV65_PERCH|nr:40S ribosomal protein S12 [Perkinsus chesapeaki]